MMAREMTVTKGVLYTLLKSIANFNICEMNFCCKPNSVNMNSSLLTVPSLHKKHVSSVLVIFFCEIAKIIRQRWKESVNPSTFVCIYVLGKVGMWVVSHPECVDTC